MVGSLRNLFIKSWKYLKMLSWDFNGSCLIVNTQTSLTRPFVRGDFLTGSEINPFPKVLLKITHLEFCPQLDSAAEFPFDISWREGGQHSIPVCPGLRISQCVGWDNHSRKETLVRISHKTVEETKTSKMKGFSLISHKHKHSLYCWHWDPDLLSPTLGLHWPTVLVLGGRMF